MPKLPAVTGTQVIRAFEKAGFSVTRITGSHHIMKKEGHPRRLSIPVHGSRIVGRGLVQSQITEAGLTIEQFITLLD